MDSFTEYIESLGHPEHQLRMTEILKWVQHTFPDLVPVIKWNQPMFTDHGTYIIGFSASKQHLSVAPEQKGILQFSEKIEAAGYSHTKELFRIKWTQPIDYDLLEEMIQYNREDKKDCDPFWRSVK